MSRTALGHLGWRRPSGSHAPSGAQPNLADIIAARKRIRGMAALTPLRPSDAMSRHCGAPVYFKLETMQPTGAFKVRGAANHILSLSADQRRAGVITVSTGNHGRAVAYVACALAIRCVVCLSSLVPANKIAAIEALGAEVDVGGADQDAAMERAIARACAEGMTLVPPFDHPAVIAGQGTIGLEIAEDLLPVGTVIAPLSGGGLIGGIAAALKPIDPRIRVVAIASERCPAMLESLKAGWPVMVEERSSLADLPVAASVSKMRIPSRWCAISWTRCGSSARTRRQTRSGLLSSMKGSFSKVPRRRESPRSSRLRPAHFQVRSSSW